jgi:hypothetical protein
VVRIETKDIFSGKASLFMALFTNLGYRFRCESSSLGC